MWANLKYRELAAAILLLFPVVLGVGPALAQPALTNQLPIWLGQATLTGDWGGVRTRLKNAGIDLNAEFLTESAANPIGGRLQAARYAQEIDFGADLDLDRFLTLANGKTQITLTDDIGRSLSNDAIGSQFQVQELFIAHQSFRLPS